MTRHIDNGITSGNMIGESAPMRVLFRNIEKVAPYDVTVLIVGETGTGKERAARAVHHRSDRRHRSFVAMNCAAVPESIAEGVLFGHERGAFTGATAPRGGKFEHADGGTLFLDEVGDMSLTLQAKVLRVIQEREVERIGGEKPIALDLRIVAATNRNLEDGVREGWFREDLYYRLNVLRITVPPLRERTGDILLLAEHFISLYAKEYNRDIRGMTERVRRSLAEYRFPGNVRELQNMMKRAVIWAENPYIHVRDLYAAPGFKTEAPGDGTDASMTVNKLTAILEGIPATASNSRCAYWHETLRCTSVEAIARFLAERQSAGFSRNDFFQFLNARGSKGGCSDKTAGVYLGILKREGILSHNGGRSQQARYRIVGP